LVDASSVLGAYRYGFHNRASDSVSFLLDRNFGRVKYLFFRSPKHMRNCLWNCFFGIVGWIIGAAGVSALVAYFLGITIVIAGVSVVTIGAGLVAGLVAAGFVLVVGSAVALAICYVRCRRR
jgi:hypothetical protein